MKEFSNRNVRYAANKQSRMIGPVAMSVIILLILLVIGTDAIRAQTGVCATPDFGARTTFGVGTNPRSVTAGDFNLDGNVDLVAANFGSDNVSIIRGNGTGGFSTRTNFVVHDGPWAVTAGDFNADGKPDLATANNGSNDVSVLLGNGAGGFSAAANFAVGGTGPMSITTGDFNADGKLDLATANNGSNSISVLFGNGAGGFSAVSVVVVGIAPYSLTTDDFNADGHPDLATANSGSNGVSVLLGNGAAGFSAPLNFGTGADPRSVTTDDVDQDGHPDLLVANFGSNSVSVLTGNGTGGFSAATNFAVGGTPNSVTTGDFNGDGRTDLATSETNSGRISILLGNGTGGFSAATTFVMGNVPYGVTAGDFNLDGKTDVAVVNNINNSVSIRLNTCIGNSAPTAENDSYAVDEDSSLTVSVADGVLANDAGNEMSSLIALIVSDPANGTLQLNSDGSFIYQPNPDFNGSDSFIYKANDGGPDSDPATVSITVGEVNDTPAVTNDSKSTDEDSPLTFPAADLTANDTAGPVDESLQTLTVTTVIPTTDTNGQVGLVNGQISYLPEADYYGAASFDYRVCDNGTTGGQADSQCAVGTVDVTVDPVNDAPSIGASAVTRQQAAGATRSAIAVVGDIEDAANTLVVTVNGSAAATSDGVSVANLAVDAAGNVTADVAAACGASNASFTLKVTDSGDLTATATLNVTVTAETVRPVIDPDSYSDIVVYLPLHTTAASAIVEFPLPTATDNCAANPAVTTDPASGSEFSLGTTTVTINATDEAGNEAVPANFTVSVRYNFSGFLAPIDSDRVNKVKAGQSIPVKFSLSGYQGAAVIAAITSRGIDCTSGETDGTGMIEINTAGNSGLRYDASTDTYTYVWKTEKAWKGSCRELMLTLADGSVHTVRFSFR
jgi:hypothetical protein